LEVLYAESRHPVPVTTFTISCGLIARTSSMPQSSIWLVSPRTGRRVMFTDGRRRELGRAWSKVIAAVASGKRNVVLTRDELSAVGKLVADQDAIRRAPRVRFFSKSWSR
jgi:hypothetical protein